MIVKLTRNSGLPIEVWLYTNESDIGVVNRVTVKRKGNSRDMEYIGARNRIWLKEEIENTGMGEVDYDSLVRFA